MRPILSYSVLLERAESETAQLLKSLTDLRQQDTELSTLRNRVDLKFLDQHHHQRRELMTRIYILEADLRRSRGREAWLRKLLAEGQVRENPLVAVA